MIPPATGGTDDPNSSGPNPNDRAKMEMGKQYAGKDASALGGCVLPLLFLGGLHRRTR